MLQLPALAFAAAHGDAQRLHVQGEAGLIFVVHWRVWRRRGLQGCSGCICWFIEVTLASLHTLDDCACIASSTTSLRTCK